MTGICKNRERHILNSIFLIYWHTFFYFGSKYDQHILSVTFVLRFDFVNKVFFEGTGMCGVLEVSTENKLIS